jgi:hypothetical protein
VNWLDLIGWAGSALLVWSLLQTRILRLRLYNLIGCGVLIFFNGALRIWPMVGLNIMLALVNLYYLRKLITTRHDEKTYSVVEVDPSDGVLNHLLAVHATDIRAFNPGFAKQPGGLAFVVMSGDDLAGVVLAHDAGERVAQVDLDYVTQRFRDFSPGYFVYNQSVLFAKHGFRKILTPAGMVKPYYPKLGFRREGDRYALLAGQDVHDAGENRG